MEKPIAAAAILAAIAAVYLATKEDKETGPVDYQPDPSNVTLSPGRVRYLANEIYVAIWGENGWALTEDEQAVIRLLVECQTNDDLLAVSKAYGCRMPALSLGCLTLHQTIAEFFSDAERAQLNDALVRRGITIQF